VISFFLCLGLLEGVIECIDHARSREVCGEVGGGKEFIEKW
jgi:hypothetical protein